MTVKELREKLEAMPQDLDVMTDGIDGHVMMVCMTAITIF